MLELKELVTMSRLESSMMSEFISVRRNMRMFIKKALENLPTRKFYSEEDMFLSDVTIRDEYGDVMLRFLDGELEIDDISLDKYYLESQGLIECIGEYLKDYRKLGKIVNNSHDKMDSVVRDLDTPL